MTNQLTKLFDMTDTSDVPDEVIEALLKLAGRDSSNVSAETVRREAKHGCRFDCTFIAFARLLAREHPEWVEDPDLVAAREFYVVVLKQADLPTWAAKARSGKYDHTPTIKAIVAAIKATRAAERERAC